MKFNDTLDKYIKLINCSSKDIAINAQLSESLISRYRNGSRIPTDKNLKKISSNTSCKVI